MTAFAKSKVVLIFEVGTIDGRSMAMDLHYQGNVQRLADLPQGVLHHTMDVEFPSSMRIEISGKGVNDTKVDSQGRIIEDKYILLKNILVDGHPIDQNWCCRFVVLRSDDHGPIVSNYWGFNGVVDLDFDSDNSFKWLAKTRRP